MLLKQIGTVIIKKEHIQLLPYSPRTVIMSMYNKMVHAIIHKESFLWKAN